MFLLSPLQAQQAGNMLVNATGKGYTGSGQNKSMNLTTLSQGTTHHQDFGFTLTDNVVKTGKSGAYKIAVSAGITDQKIVSQQLGYAIYVNDNIISTVNYSQIPPSGIYEVQLNIQKGDKISVAVEKNSDLPDDSAENVIRLEKIDR